MANNWFTADFHLGHSNIIRYCGRPFRATDEMDEAILNRLNMSVKERDSLYYLGDFCLGSSQHAREYRRRIRCKNIYFIEGNHDASTRKIQGEFLRWKQLAEITVGVQRIVLCHYAMRVWHHCGRGAWQLYGHSHGRLPEACSRWMSALTPTTSGRGISTRSKPRWKPSNAQRASSKLTKEKTNEFLRASAA
jgi:calcineurin-like phosphoesterase family protein